MYSHRPIFSVGLGVLVILGLLLWAPAARPHWYPDDPYKMDHPQTPDLGGIAVAANPTLADDFLCTESGFITDIHIWGAFFKNVFYTPFFVLSFWSDLPEGPNNPYSIPDRNLWSYLISPARYSYRLWETVDNEPFFDIYGEFSGTDNRIYQFNLPIAPRELFYQEKGKIYWLSVYVEIPDETGLFGWKTTDQPWNDVAVWKDNFGEWHQISYEGNSKWDMAFVINSTPIPLPGSLLLLGSGLLGLGALGWRRRKQG